MFVKFHCPLLLCVYVFPIYYLCMECREALLNLDVTKITVIVLLYDFNLHIHIYTYYITCIYKAFKLMKTYIES